MCAKLKSRPQAQGLALSPFLFLLSGLLCSAKHHVKAHFSPPVWVGLPCPPPLPYSRKRVALATSILSHNIKSNTKYFTQPQDSPQPLALDWDEENLPEKVEEAGVSMSYCAFLPLFWIRRSICHSFKCLITFFSSQDARRDIQHLFISLTPPHAFLSYQTKCRKFTFTSCCNPGLPRT